MKKHDLLKELERLFKLYDTDDWVLVIKQFQKFVALDSNSKSATKKRTPKKQQKNKRVASKTPTSFDLTEIKASPRRTKILYAIKDRLEQNHSRRWTLAQIRGLYLLAGGKHELPSKRADAIRALLVHLASLDDKAFRFALRALSNSDEDLQADYSKWFGMIYGRSSNKIE